MGNRLNVSFIVNLREDTPENLLNDLRKAGKDDTSKFGFMNNNFNYCDGKQVFYVSVYEDKDREVYSGRYDKTYWLEVHTCFKNYNGEFEDFWDAITPYIILHNGEGRPVGHFWNDSKMGLIMVDGLKLIDRSDLKYAGPFLK